MRRLNVTILGPVSTNANRTSLKIDANQLIRMSMMATISGTITGSVQMQGSNDPTPMGNIAVDFTPVNWVNVGSPVTLTTANTYLIPAQEICYRWMRVVFTDGSSGANTASIIINAMALSV